MPFIISVIMIYIVASFMVTSHISMESKRLERKNGAYDRTSGTFVENRGVGVIFDSQDYSISENMTKVQTLENILIKTCRAVSTIAHANGCADWSRASYVWSFVGGVGVIGNLNLLTTGTSSNTFTCLTSGNFGRGLFQNSLAPSYLNSASFTYDFTQINDANLDPCGYSNIVRF